MPGRIVPLVTHEIYHVFNRGIARLPIFQSKRDYRRFIEILGYYAPIKPPIRYSRFLMLPVEQREQFLSHAHAGLPRGISCLAYCLMPNHFHLLLQQEVDGGISKYLANVSNSYTRYINTKTKREGPLLQGKFKAVHIEDMEQLLHVFRYIHLNPYTGAIVNNIDSLLAYPFSSLPIYLQPSENSWISKAQILEEFKSRKSFVSFIEDQADFQRSLKYIKHLTIDEEN